VKDAALNSDKIKRLDPHFVKAIQVMVAFGQGWGEEGFFWFNAAKGFARDFTGWTGLGKRG